MQEVRIWNPPMVTCICDRNKSRAPHHWSWSISKLKYLSNNGNATDAGNDQSMFVLTILEKIRETRPKCSQESVTILWKMAYYEEARVKLTNTQLNKLKSDAKIILE